MSVAVAVRGVSLVFGEVLWNGVAGFGLCPLIADDPVIDLILPRNLLGNG
jgi:hypothetical protein